MLQFLSGTGSPHGVNGAGLQLAASDIDLVTLDLLAVAGGTGAYLALRATDGDADNAESRAHPAETERAGRERSVAHQELPPPWPELLDDLDPAEPGLPELVTRLALAGAPPPVLGWELGSAGWLAELAWPARRLAVLTDPAGRGVLDPEEQGRRDAAYAEAGWDARLVPDWPADDLIKRLSGTDEGDRT